MTRWSYDSDSGTISRGSNDEPFHTGFIAARVTGYGGGYAEHSPSMTTGSKAWVSPRSMKSSGPAASAVISARSLRRSVASAGAMRR